MVTMRSASRIISRVMARARWAERSRPCSSPTSSEKPEAWHPSRAEVPADDTATSKPARAGKILRATASARGLRQVFPEQTNRIFFKERRLRRNRGTGRAHQTVLERPIVAPQRYKQPVDFATDSD